ncbi:hypothetical protein T08_2112, partial [Trichinella sp. T8]
LSQSAQICDEFSNRFARPLFTLIKNVSINNFRRLRRKMVVQDTNNFIERSFYRLGRR